MAHATPLLALVDALDEARRLLRELESNDASGVGDLRERIGRLELTIASPLDVVVPDLLADALAVREAATALAQRHDRLRAMVMEMMD